MKVKRKKVPAWLVYTRKERNVALWIGISIILINGIPCLRTAIKPEISQQEPPAFFATWFASDTLQEEDRDAPPFISSEVSGKDHAYSDAKNFMHATDMLPAHLFAPDTSGAEDWIAAGVPEFMAQRIIRYLSTGAQLRKKDDLFRIYGMDSVLFIQIEQYIDLPEKTSEDVHDQKNQMQIDLTRLSPVYPEQASVEEMHALGFSSYEIKRIQEFIVHAGGLYSIDQLFGLYGVDTAHLRTVSSFLLCDPKDLRMLHLNSAGFDKLAAHPYLSDKLAQEIIAYREKTGKFYSVSEVMKVPGMSKYLYEKIKPYLTL